MRWPTRPWMPTDTGLPSWESNRHGGGGTDRRRQCGGEDESRRVRAHRIDDILACGDVAAAAERLRQRALDHVDAVQGGLRGSHPAALLGASGRSQMLLTQNVDRLHQAAGSRVVIAGVGIDVQRANAPVEFVVRLRKVREAARTRSTLNAIWSNHRFSCPRSRGQETAGGAGQPISRRWRGRQSLCAVRARQPGRGGQVLLQCSLRDLPRCSNHAPQGMNSRHQLSPRKSLRTAGRPRRP